MTILIAVKNKDKIILAADSMSVEWDRQYNQTKKIIKFDNFALWFSWTLLHKQLFDMNANSIRIGKKKLANVTFDTIDEVWKFFNVLKKIYSEEWIRWIDDKYENSFDSNIMIVTKSMKIYVIDSMWYIEEFDHFAVRWSGQYVWLWALEYAKYFDRDLWTNDLENVVEKVYNIVSRNITSCWWDYLHTYSFTNEKSDSVPEDNGTPLTNEESTEEVTQ